MMSVKMPGREAMSRGRPLKPRRRSERISERLSGRWRRRSRRTLREISWEGT